MTDEQNTQPSQPTTVGPDPSQASPAQPVDTPVQPEETTDFDHGVGDDTVDESQADYEAEEQNRKEETTE